MSLMQEILTKIEQEAAAESATAMRHAGLIYEAEELRERLHKTGMTTCEPIFLRYGGIIFYDSDCNSTMRAALNAIGVEIESEEYEFEGYGNRSQPPNTRTAKLSLKGLSCRVWIHYEPIPLAEAA